MARFDKFMADKNTVPITNGHVHEVKDKSPEPSPKHPAPCLGADKKRVSDDDELSEVPDSPPKKKRKAQPVVNDDAAFAAKLQAEENSRARPTRGGANRKAPLPKKKRSPKKKTSQKVKASDDSDLQDSGSNAEEKKVNRSGGFHVRSPSSISIRFS